MTVTTLMDRRQSERRFFAIAAIIFPLVMLAGFGRTYYLKPLFASPPLPSMVVHVHGLLMTAWIALFVTQVWLISSRRVKTHQQLGIAGVILALLIIPFGLLTAIGAAKYGSASTPRDIPPLTFMIVPLVDLLMFAVLFGAAVYYRKRPAEHKRLIVLTVLNFMPPAIARLPLAFVLAAGPLAFFGIPDLIAIALVTFDTVKTGKLNRVFAAGTAILIVSQPLRLMVGTTAPWLRFAAWLTA